MKYVKLTKIHLFLLLLFTLMCGSCLFGTRLLEGMAGNENDDSDKNNEAGSNFEELPGNMDFSKQASALPQGIPRNEIPAGQQDLYILKSQVVPPVCPVCPSINDGKKPPPCPPCARCPEPSFDCKKVPNYNSNNEQYLPKPMLSDFSSF